MIKYAILLLLVSISGCASLEERCAERYGDATDGYWNCIQVGLAKRQAILQALSATRSHQTQCYGVGPNLRCVTY